MHTDFHFLHQLLKRSLSCKGNSDLFNRVPVHSRRAKTEARNIGNAGIIWGSGGFPLCNEIALVGPGSQVRKINTMKSVWRYLRSKPEFEGLLKSTQSNQQWFSLGCLCCQVSLHGFLGRSSVFRHHKIGVVCFLEPLELHGESCWLHSKPMTFQDCYVGLC